MQRRHQRREDRGKTHEQNHDDENEPHVVGLPNRADGFIHRTPRARFIMG